MTDSNDINKEQILQDHSQLIHRVVRHCVEPGSVADLEQLLELAEVNDWEKLVETIRNIMSGNRERSLLQNLDEEESIIIESILNGIEDPGTLPSVQVDLNSDMAAPGIASLIHASIQGSAESKDITNNLTKQMLDTGGDYAIIADRIRQMTEGERDSVKLSAGIPEHANRFVEQVLAELIALDA